MKKKFLLSTLMLSGLFGLSASAQNFTGSDGLTYTVTSTTDKTVSVAKPAKAYAIKDVVIPATVTNEGVTYKVTGIANQAFMSNTTLETLKVSDGVLTIGDQAFQTCSNLTTVDLGNTVTYLGNQTFFSCSKITTLKLSKTIKTLAGKWNFRALTSLVELEWPEALEAVPDGCCWGDTKLKIVNIPDKVKYIGENAFASCSAIDSITLGESVDSLAAKAFAYVSNCKKVTSRAAVPPVCGDEKSMVSSYTKTELYVKEKSLELYQKTLPWSQFEKILPYDPSGSLEDKNFVIAGIGYEMLSKDDLTVGVTHIDTLVYKGEILIRPTVNYAGSEFKVIAVQPNAFKNCTEVTQIEMPATIATIGNDAFNGCTGMKYMIIKAVTPPTLGTNVFTGATANCKLYVAREGAATYKTADQWKDFTNRSIVIDEVTVNGISYKCNDIINCTLDFTGAKGAAGSLVIPDEVLIDEYPFYVTNIAGNSFYNTDITALKLPKTLKTISGNAFFSLGKYDRPIERIVVPEGVTSIGSNAFYGSHVNYVDLPKKSLTNLAGSAFYSCDIKGIEIPGSVGVINAQTFYGSKMNYVILGEGITEIKSSAFWATKIGSVRLPSTMKVIGDNAFGACSYLSSLTINEGLDSVSANAFSNCTSLYKVFSFATKMPTGLVAALNDSGERIESGARSTYSVSDIMTNGVAFGTVTIRPDLASWFDCNGVRYLPDAANSTDVTAVDASYSLDDINVTVPQTFSYNGKSYKVTKVLNYLLCGQTVMNDVNVSYPFTELPAGFAYNAVNLKNIKLPNTITSLGKYCFAMTDSLAKVDLPEGLTNIGLAAFYYSGIKEATIPSTVTLMENASYAGCRNLTELTFKDGNNSVLIGYFPTMFGNRPMFSSSKLNKVVIGRNLEFLSGASYGYSPFYGDSIVEHVEFTNAPTLILANIFKACKSIKTLYIGNSVRKIGNTAFDGCLALDSIYLGDGVNSLGTDVFKGCSNVTKLYAAPATPPTVANGALADINKQTCKLFVPASSIDKYKAADQWKEFFNISDYPFAGITSVFGDQMNGRYIVYNLNGIMLLDTTDESLVNDLPAGVYIINGKKVVKR